MNILTTPLMDTIDKRNYHDFIKSTVIKGYNVNYIPNMPETSGKDAQSAEGKTEIGEKYANEQVQSREEVKALEKAEEVFSRLQQEAQENEDEKYEEWSERIRVELEAEKMKADSYNSATGSYSGLYGQGEVSDEARQMMNRIKGESNTNAVEHLVESLSKEAAGGE